MAKMDSEENIAALSSSLINIAVESWRFGKLFDRMLTKMDAGEQSRYRSQFRWFLKKLEESLSDSGMRLVNVEGQIFDPGMAATALNIDEFGENDELIVEQMLEPIIMGPDGILRSGTVMLRKVEQ